MPQIDASDPMRPKILSTETGEPERKAALPSGEKPKREKVVTGAIMQKKKNFLDKFSETFFGDDAKSVGQYIVWDVLVPAAKNTVVEMVKSGIEMLIFGERGSPIVRRDRDRVVIPYDRISTRDGYRVQESSSLQRRDERPRQSSAITNYRFDEIIFSRKSDAVAVLEQLANIVEQYELTTVGDFKEACGGLLSEFTDEKYGWDRHDLVRTEVVPVHGGYILTIPRPHVLS